MYLFGDNFEHHDGVNRIQDLEFMTGQWTLVFDKTLKALFFVRVGSTIEQVDHCQDDKAGQNQLHYAPNSD